MMCFITKAMPINNIEIAYNKEKKLTVDNADEAFIMNRFCNWKYQVLSASGDPSYYHGPLHFWIHNKYYLIIDLWIHATTLDSPLSFGFHGPLLSTFGPYEGRNLEAQ